MNKINFTNTDIARIFSEMALLYEVGGVKYKPRAFERASDGVRGHAMEAGELYEKEGIKGLETIDGVGASIAGHIEELLTTGSLGELEQLRNDIPVDVKTLSRIEGVGPQKIKTLYEELGIKTLDDLGQAVTEHKVQELKGFGAKTEENIAEGIAFVRESSGRFLRAHVSPDVTTLCDALEGLAEVERVEVVGSYRRGKETVGDIDIVCATTTSNTTLCDALEDCAFVVSAHKENDHSIRVDLVSGIDADIHVASSDSWGSELVRYTGSQAHVDALEQCAQSKGVSLKDHSSEEEVYVECGLSYIPPELRENTGEIEAAEKGTLPELIDYAELRGDLQMHTEWSDGRNTIEERARYALEMGYEYIAITDHTQSLRMTGGLDETRLRKQMCEIREINEKLADEGHAFRILAGAEVNIMRDGSFDVDDDVLHELDMVGVALHSYFDLPRDEQTARVVRALKHPAVNIMNHPTARLINKRPGADFDFDAVMETAKKHRVALEIDAPPERLDLSDVHVRQCVENGVMLVIDSDAHSNEGLHNIVHGITQARRGWATKDTVLNTRTREDLLSWFGEK